MSGRASSVHGVKSSGSIIIVVVVSYRKSRTFSVDIYYYSAQSIYGSTNILSSLTSTVVVEVLATVPSTFVAHAKVFLIFLIK